MTEVDARNRCGSFPAPQCERPGVRTHRRRNAGPLMMNGRLHMTLSRRPYEHEGDTAETITRLNLRASFGMPGCGRLRKRHAPRSLEIGCSETSGASSAPAFSLHRIAAVVLSRVMDVAASQRLLAATAKERRAEARFPACSAGGRGSGMPNDDHVKRWH